MSAHPDTESHVDLKNLRDIEVERIDRNPKNPRLHFTEEELDKLRQSVNEKGILVPVVVYPDGEKFRLIDGERRWLVAQDLGLTKIPAVITDRPDARENLVQMFNIHMVREPWRDMPTAWALRDLMEETGAMGDREVSELTGLSTERIKRLRHALDLPAEYQAYIDEGSIPLNFFWELKENVIDPLAKNRPILWMEFDEDEVLKAFVGKRQEGIVGSAVSLRHVRSIIAMAAREVENLTESSELDDTLRALVQDPEMTIEEAYQDTVEIVVEADKLQRRTDNMVKSFSRLLDKARNADEVEYVRSVGRDLIERIKAIV